MEIHEKKKGRKTYFVHGELDNAGWEKESVFVRNVTGTDFELVVGVCTFRMVFEDRLYFVGATEDELKNVVRETCENIHWPEIDVDLALSWLINPPSEYVTSIAKRRIR